MRISLSEIVCHISPSFQVNHAVSEVLPLIEILLKDEVLDVRLNVINHIVHFNCHIGSANVRTYVLPLFSLVFKEKQWRFRLAFAEYLPTLAEQLGVKEFNEELREHTA